MKKINKDPFSNGSEHDSFEFYNCNRCVKSSHLKKEGDTMYEDEYTKLVCSVQRDIINRMISNEPISQRTIDICNGYTLKGKLCPYLKTERKKYAKKQPINQQVLAL